MTQETPTNTQEVDSNQAVLQELLAQTKQLEALLPTLAQAEAATALTTPADQVTATTAPIDATQPANPVIDQSPPPTENLAEELRKLSGYDLVLKIQELLKTASNSNLLFLVQRLIAGHESLERAQKKSGEDRLKELRGTYSELRSNLGYVKGLEQAAPSYVSEPIPQEVREHVNREVRAYFIAQLDEVTKQIFGEFQQQQVAGESAFNLLFTADQLVGLQQYLMGNVGGELRRMTPEAIMELIEKENVKRLPIDHPNYPRQRESWRLFVTTFFEESRVAGVLWPEPQKKEPEQEKQENTNEVFSDTQWQQFVKLLEEKGLHLRRDEGDPNRYKEVFTKIARNPSTINGINPSTEVLAYLIKTYSLENGRALPPRTAVDVAAALEKASPTYFNRDRKENSKTFWKYLHTTKYANIVDALEKNPIDLDQIEDYYRYCGQDGYLITHQKLTLLLSKAVAQVLDVKSDLTESPVITTAQKELINGLLIKTFGIQPETNDENFVWQGVTIVDAKAKNVDDKTEKVELQDQAKIQRIEQQAIQYYSVAVGLMDGVDPVAQRLDARAMMALLKRLPPHTRKELIEVCNRGGAIHELFNSNFKPIDIVLKYPDIYPESVQLFELANYIAVYYEDNKAQIDKDETILNHNNEDERRARLDYVLTHSDELRQHLPKGVTLTTQDIMAAGGPASQDMWTGVTTLAETRNRVYAAVLEAVKQKRQDEKFEPGWGDINHDIAVAVTSEFLDPKQFDKRNVDRSGSWRSLETWREKLKSGIGNFKKRFDTAPSGASTQVDELKQFKEKITQPSEFDELLAVVSRIPDGELSPGEIRIKNRLQALIVELKAGKGNNNFGWDALRNGVAALSITAENNTFERTVQSPQSKDQEHEQDVASAKAEMELALNKLIPKTKKELLKQLIPLGAGAMTSFLIGSINKGISPYINMSMSGVGLLLTTAPGIQYAAQRAGLRFKESDVTGLKKTGELLLQIGGVIGEQLYNLDKKDVMGINTRQFVASFSIGLALEMGLGESTGFSDKVRHSVHNTIMAGVSEISSLNKPLIPTSTPTDAAHTALPTATPAAESHLQTPTATQVNSPLSPLATPTATEHAHSPIATPTATATEHAHSPLSTVTPTATEQPRSPIATPVATAVPTVVGEQASHDQTNRIFIPIPPGTQEPQNPLHTGEKPGFFNQLFNMDKSPATATEHPVNLGKFPVANANTDGLGGDMTVGAPALHQAGEKPGFFNQLFNNNDVQFNHEQPNKIFTPQFGEVKPDTDHSHVASGMHLPGLEHNSTATHGSGWYEAVKGYIQKLQGAGLFGDPNDHHHKHHEATHIKTEMPKHEPRYESGSQNVYTDNRGDGRSVDHSHDNKSAEVQSHKAEEHHKHPQPEIHNNPVVHPETVMLTTLDGHNYDVKIGNETLHVELTRFDRPNIWTAITDTFQDHKDGSNLFRDVDGHLQVEDPQHKSNWIDTQVKPIVAADTIKDTILAWNKMINPNFEAFEKGAQIIVIHGDFKIGEVQQAMAALEKQHIHVDGFILDHKGLLNLEAFVVDKYADNAPATDPTSLEAMLKVHFNGLRDVGGSNYGLEAKPLAENYGPVLHELAKVASGKHPDESLRFFEPNPGSNEPVVVVSTNLVPAENVAPVGVQTGGDHGAGKVGEHVVVHTDNHTKVVDHGKGDNHGKVPAENNVVKHEEHKAETHHEVKKEDAAHVQEQQHPGELHLNAQGKLDHLPTIQEMDKLPANMRIELARMINPAHPDNPRQAAYLIVEYANNHMSEPLPEALKILEKNHYAENLAKLVDASLKDYDKLCADLGKDTNTYFKELSVTDKTHGVNGLSGTKTAIVELVKTGKVDVQFDTDKGHRVINLEVLNKKLEDGLNSAVIMQKIDQGDVNGAIAALNIVDYSSQAEYDQKVRGVNP